MIALLKDAQGLITITSKSRYAVTALSELAQRKADVPVPIADIAARRDIPVQFLEQLFSTLRRAGILQSQRGVKGGYLFAREPQRISVLEVVEALDGRVVAGAKGAGKVFEDSAQALASSLAATTIEDVAEAEAPPGSEMYYI